MSGSTINSSNSQLDVPSSKRGSIGSGSAVTDVFDHEDALKPDPGTEADFQVENNSFAFVPGQLNKLQNPKSLPAFAALGGLSGLESGLRTNISTGLSVDETVLDGTVTFGEAVTQSQKLTDVTETVLHPPAATAETTSVPPNAFQDRIRIFKRNVLPPKRPTPLWKLVWLAYNDKVLILLTAAAGISLALGLYETFGVKHAPGDPTPVDWIEGVAICIAIVVVILVGSLNDFQKERAFVKLNTKVFAAVTNR